MYFFASTWHFVHKNEENKISGKIQLTYGKSSFFSFNFISNFCLNLMPINLYVLLLEQENSIEIKKIQQGFS